MSNRADATPPSSAPETFTVEGFTVTKHGDNLLLQKPASATNFIVFFALPAALYLVYFLNSLRIWLNMHNKSGPLDVLWNDPAVRAEVYTKVILYLLGVTCWAVGQWYGGRSTGRGATTVNLATRRAQIGKQSDTIEAVGASYEALFFVRRYLVSLRTVTGATFGRGQNIYIFRHKENAERFAREIATFLGVPLREFFSASEGLRRPARRRRGS